MYCKRVKINYHFMSYIQYPYNQQTHPHMALKEQAMISDSEERH